MSFTAQFWQRAYGQLNQTAGLTRCSRTHRLGQCSPYLAEALGPQASTSFQTLRIKKGLELFLWNFLRETKKVLPEFTFKF